MGLFHRDPIYRRWHHHELTFGQVYAYSENYVLAFSHDEVVHGKGSLIGKVPGEAWQQTANLRLLLARQTFTPGKKLMFMGGEFGQQREWSESRELDWRLLGDGGGIEACAGEWMNRPANLEITLPPLAVVVLQQV